MKIFEDLSVFSTASVLLNCFCAARVYVHFFSHSESANASSLNIQFKIQSDDCHSLK